MLNVIVRKSGKQECPGMVARLQKDGHIVMYASMCPYQGVGETAEKAIGVLFLMSHQTLGLTSAIDQSPEAVSDPVVFGRALMASATDTRNFLIQIEPTEFWDD